MSDNRRHEMNQQSAVNRKSVERYSDAAALHECQPYKRLQDQLVFAITLRQSSVRYRIPLSNTTIERPVRKTRRSIVQQHEEAGCGSRQSRLAVFPCGKQRNEGGS